MLREGRLGSGRTDPTKCSKHSGYVLCEFPCLVRDTIGEVILNMRTMGDVQRVKPVPVATKPYPK